MQKQFPALFYLKIIEVHFSLLKCIKSYFSYDIYIAIVLLKSTNFILNNSIQIV